MLQNLVKLVMIGTVSLGTGGGADFFQNLTEGQQEELISAREASVEVLSADEVKFITSLEEQHMRDLTDEEREQLFEIRNDLHEETLENITDEDLREELEARRSEMQEKRETTKEHGMRRGTKNFRNE